MHSGSSQIINIDLNVLLIGLNSICGRCCCWLGVSHVYSIKVVYYLQNKYGTKIFSSYFRPMTMKRLYSVSGSSKPRLPE